MSKVITVPSGRDPLIISVNGKTYTLYAGQRTTVPDEVAEVIENFTALQPKEDPNAGTGDGGASSAALAELEELMDGLADRVEALEEAQAGSAGVRIVPFSMSVSEQGAISVTTDADQDDALQALADGQLVVADVQMVIGSTVAHNVGVLSGAIDDVPANRSLDGVILTETNGSITAYKIEWLHGTAPTMTPYPLANAQ